MPVNAILYTYLGDYFGKTVSKLLYYIYNLILSTIYNM